MNIQKDLLAITILLSASAISLPILTSGFLAGQALGFLPASLCIFIAGSLVSIIASLSSYIGAKTHKDTLFLAKEYFGTVGIVMVAISLAIALTGWFAFQLYCICSTLQTLYVNMPIHLCIFLFGSILILFRLLGIKKIGFIAVICSPPLLGILVFVATQISTIPDIIHIIHPATVLLTIGGLLGTTITATLELPILYQTIQQPKQAIISCLSIFGIFIPGLQILGAYIGTATATDLLPFLVQSLPQGEATCALLIIISSMLANILNLYSSSKTVERLIPSLGTTKSTFLAGISGICLARSPILRNSMVFFSLLTVAAGSLTILFTYTHLQKIKKTKRSITPMHALYIWIGAIIGAFFSQYIPAQNLFINPLLTGIVITTTLVVLIPKKKERNLTCFLHETL